MPSTFTPNPYPGQTDTGTNDNPTGTPTSGNSGPYDSSSTTPPTSTQPSASSTLSKDYSATGDFAATKRLFNLATIRSQTRWNPPTPKEAASTFLVRNNQVGWMAPDPMQLTGYTAAPNTLKDKRDANRDQFDFAKRTYGVRFHFNPTNVSESFSNTQGTDPIRSLQAITSVPRPPLAKQSGATFNFDIFFSRVFDMRVLRQPQSVWRSAYSPTLSHYEPNVNENEMRDQVLSRGTMIDVEYIFRLVNGKPFPVWWSDSPDGSADWGAFFPRPVVVSFGDEQTSRRLRGFLTSMSVSHQQFAPGMVPIYTTVSLAMERLLDSQAAPVDWDNPDKAVTVTTPSATTDAPSLETIRNLPAVPPWVE